MLRIILGTGRENYALLIARVVCAEINDKYWQEGKFLESPIIMLSPQLRALGGNLADPAEFAQVASEVKFLGLWQGSLNKAITLSASAASV